MDFNDAGMAKGIIIAATRIIAYRLPILMFLWVWACQRPVAPQADKCAYPAVSPGPLHLLMGNPSAARADTNQPGNYLMEKPQYVLSYNRSKLHANWVAWHLTGGDLGGADRQDDFRPDPALPVGWRPARRTIPAAVLTGATCAPRPTGRLPTRIIPPHS